MSQFEEFIRCERVTFWIWKILGIWATRDESPFYRAFRRVYHFWFTFVFLAAMFVSSFFTENSEELWVEILWLLPTEMAMATKTVITVYNFEAVYELHRKTVSEDFKPGDGGNSKGYKEFFRRFSQVMLLYYFCSFCAAWTHLGFLPYFDDRYKLPFFNWFFWVPLGRANPVNYYILFAYQMIAMMGHCSLNVSGDMQLAYLLSTASKQLDLLHDRFSNLPVPKARTSVEKKFFRQVFIENVERYNRIYNFTRDVERIFSLAVFAQICASGVTICAIVFRLSAISIIDHLGTSIPMFFYLAAMLTQIFLPCFFGNEITLKSQKLTRDLFDSEWCELAIAERKEIKMMMVRTGKPIGLKAGRFFNFNLDAFTSTLNTAYSLYAVLNSTERNKKQHYPGNHQAVNVNFSITL